MKQTVLSVLRGFLSTKNAHFVSILPTAVCFLFPLVLLAQLQISSVRPNANYAVGETAQFQVTAFTTGTMTYDIKYDEHTPVVHSGSVYVQAGVPATVSYAHPEPGLVILKANLNGQTGKAAVAFGASDILSQEAEPSDFDAFWNNQKAMIQAVPHDAQLQFLADNGKTKDYSISLGNVDGRRVYGYISVPNGVGPFPALLHLPPFGSGANLVTPDTYLADELGAIVMHISVHNSPANQAPSSPYAPNDPTNRDQIYYRWAILGALQAIDYLNARPDVDAQYIGVFGESQGGGLSMITAGLDNRVKLAMTTIPALCDHTGWKYGKAAGFPQYMHWASVSSFGNQAIIDAVGNAVPYYDAQYFLKRYHGPLYSATSYLDEICPSNTVLTATNQHLGPQIVVHSTNLEHTHPGVYWGDRPSMTRLYFPPTRTPQNNPYAPTSTGYKIDAGADQQAQVGQAINLNANIEHNQYPKPGLPAQWTLVSGPSSVNFSSANSYFTQATFSQSGTYTLRFSARDEGSIGSNYFYSLQDAVVITVGGGGNVPSISTSDVNVNEAAGVASLQICLSNTSSQDVSVQYATENGSALAGIDYAQTTGTAIIPAGATCTTVDIALVDDIEVEGDETFSFNLSAAAGATLTNSTAVITITDNDVSVPSISINDATISENGGSLSMDICLTATATQNVTVDYTTVNGEAIAGTDFQQTNGTLIIWAGSSCGSVTIPIYDDANVEGDETFSLFLSAPNGATLNNSTATLTIIDNDSAPVPNMNITDATTTEGTASVEVQICIDQAVSQDVYVDYTTTDNTAYAGSDYIYSQGTATIPAGSVCTSIYIDIVNDIITENTETFNVTLSNATGAALSTSNATITISDNDGGVSTGPPPCPANSINTWNAWIERVKLNNMERITSGASYTYFDDAILPASPSERIAATFNPKFENSNNPVRMYWRIWVDWNADGDFTDNSEMVIQRSSFGEINTSFNVPSTASEGKKRIRVIAKRNGYASSCGSFNIGEVEDYILDVQPFTPTCSITSDVQNVVCNDNGTSSDPTDDYWFFTLNVDGQNTGGQGWFTTYEGQDYFGSYGTPLTFTVSNPDGALQFLQITDAVDLACSSNLNFTAPTTCSDDTPPAADYCENISAFPWHEWIRSINMNGSEYNTSSKTTYSDFTHIEIPLSNGMNSIRTEAEFSWITAETYWKIWIDFNRNNIFDNQSELVAQGESPAPPAGAGAKASFLRDFQLPANVTSGETRMRVIMSRSYFEDACDAVDFGEIEDYTVNIPNSTNRIASNVPQIIAKMEDGKARLVWQSSLIDNVQTAWIEAASENEGFSKIIRELPTHEFGGIVYDDNPTLGLNKYRLAIQDKFGAIQYSNLSTLLFDKVALYPNPVHTQLQVDTKLFNSELDWQIKDLYGRTVLEGTHDAKEAKTLQIQLMDLKSGLFILTLSSEGKRTVSQRFVVDKG